MDYLRKYNDHSDYQADSNKPIPNVSYCVTQDEVHFNGNPMVITVSLYLDDPSSFFPTFLGGDAYNSVMVDGEEFDLSGSSSVELSAGEHVLKYFYDRSTRCPRLFANNNIYVTGLTIPEGITTIQGLYNEDREEYNPCIAVGNLDRLTIPSTLIYVEVNAICDDSGHNLSQEDIALLDSCCPGGTRAWRAFCGK